MKRLNREFLSQSENWVLINNKRFKHLPKFTNHFIWGNLRSPSFSSHWEEGTIFVPTKLALTLSNLNNEFRLKLELNVSIYRVFLQFNTTQAKGFGQKISRRAFYPIRKWFWANRKTVRAYKIGNRPKWAFELFLLNKIASEMWGVKRITFWGTFHVSHKLKVYFTFFGPPKALI